MRIKMIINMINICSCFNIVERYAVLARNCYDLVVWMYGKMFTFDISYFFNFFMCVKVKNTASIPVIYDNKIIREKCSLFWFFYGDGSNNIRSNIDEFVHCAT